MIAAIVFLWIFAAIVILAAWHSTVKHNKQ